MNKKESFLNSILDQIKILQLAYDSNKNLPDYIFENMQDISLPTNVTKNIGTEEPLKLKDDGETLEYGENKRLILKILRDNNKAMLKGEIVDKFLEVAKMPETMAINAVTNGLAAMSNDGEVIGYKPAGLKFRGKFWTLNEWWITDLKTNKKRLPLQYEPYSGKIGQL
ncbi:MAG: hypothetical protein ABI237_07615 [Ginsengibacter sp.]